VWMDKAAARLPAEAFKGHGCREGGGACRASAVRPIGKTYATTPVPRADADPIQLVLRPCLLLASASSAGLDLAATLYMTLSVAPKMRPWNDDRSQVFTEMAGPDKRCCAQRET
jgi:hypothetical protein